MLVSNTALGEQWNSKTEGPKAQTEPCALTPSTVQSSAFTSTDPEGHQDSSREVMCHTCSKQQEAVIIFTLHRQGNLTNHPPWALVLPFSQTLAVHPLLWNFLLTVKTCLFGTSLSIPRKWNNFGQPESLVLPCFST